MARPCNEPTCKKVVVFAKDEETDKWQVLSNSSPIWRVVRYEKGVPIVRRDTKALLSHFVDCTRPNQFSKKQDQPVPDRHYSEPETAE